MDLECAICFSLLAEEPDIEGPTLPAKRSRQTVQPTAGPSTRPVEDATPELCVPKCGHMFHKICLLNWIRTSNSKTCPSCRKALTERQLTTVFLPAVDQDEKKCEKCDETEKTLELVTAEKEKFKKLFEKERELRKLAEVEMKNGLEGMNNKLGEALKDKLEIEHKFLEKEAKVGELTAEKDLFKMLLEEEVKGRNVEKMEGGKREKVSELKMAKLVKEKKDLAGKLLEMQKKVGVLEQNILEGDRRVEEVTRRRDEWQKAYLDIEGKFLEERDKMEEIQGTLDELQERHRLLIGDVEEMTKKYGSEHDKANILEGRVASLEAQLEDEQKSQEDLWTSMINNDTEAPPPVMPPILDFNDLLNFLDD